MFVARSYGVTVHRLGVTKLLFVHLITFFRLQAVIMAVASCFLAWYIQLGVDINNTVRKEITDGRIVYSTARLLIDPRVLSFGVVSGVYTKLSPSSSIVLDRRRSSNVE